MGVGVRACVIACVWVCACVRACVVRDDRPQQTRAGLSPQQFVFWILPSSGGRAGLLCWACTAQIVQVERKLNSQMPDINALVVLY